MKVLPLRLLWHRERSEGGPPKPAEGAAHAGDAGAPDVALEPKMPPGAPVEDRAAQPAARVADADRRRIVERFEAWLEGVLAGEPAPTGLAEDVLAAISGGEGADDASTDRGQEAGARVLGLPDRAALWSAMTALAQEVALQGRAFKQLDTTLAPLGAAEQRLRSVEESQGDVARRLEALGEDVQALRDSARRAGQDEALGVLLDLYARLYRGLAACRAQLQSMRPPRRPVLWRRLLGRAGADSEDPERSGARGSAEALAEGYGLTLGRLLDALRAMEISPIDRVDVAFDPHTMEAVTVAHRDGAAPGTVLEIYEPGFMRRGEPIRMARVAVAAASGGAAPPFADERLEAGDE